MTTLLAVGDKDGQVRRCDASCYQASGEMCTCICGGRNHGVGQVNAMNNIHVQYDDLLQEAEILFDGPFQWVNCPVQAQQLPLPTSDEDDGDDDDFEPDDCAVSGHNWEYVGNGCYQCSYCGAETCSD